MKKSIFKIIYDFIGIPFRLVLLPDKWNKKLGFTSLEDERIYTVLPEIKGKLLDIGCGNNRLVREYGNGIGIDVYKWNDDVILYDGENLPFEDESFDTITFLASLNHIPKREKLVKEARRVLKPNGKVVLTMINPFLGYIGHKIWWYGEDRERGMEEGEKGGLSNKYIRNLFEKENFKLEKHKRFVYFLNNLFVYKKIK